MAESSEQVVRVKICNQYYDIRSTDPEYIEELAEFVDGQMSEVSDLTPTVDTARVAILTALNLADRYFAVRDELDKYKNGVAERSKRITAKLASLTRKASRGHS
jgi:cell division protein ZapA